MTDPFLLEDVQGHAEKVCPEGFLFFFFFVVQELPLRCAAAAHTLYRTKLIKVKHHTCFCPHTSLTCAATN